MNNQTNSRYCLVTFLFLLLLVSCAQNETSTIAYKSYPGHTIPDSEIATLAFGERVNEFYIDGIEVKRTDYGSVKLEPGLHEIKWKYRFAVSVLVNSTGWDEIEATTSLYLEAGHTYTVNADRTIGKGYRMILWISDEGSGQAVFAKEI